MQPFKHTSTQTGRYPPRDLDCSHHRFSLSNLSLLFSNIPQPWLGNLCSHLEVTLSMWQYKRFRRKFPPSVEASLVSLCFREPHTTTQSCAIWNSKFENFWPLDEVYSRLGFPDEHRNSYPSHFQIPSDKALLSISSFIRGHPRNKQKPHHLHEEMSDAQAMLMLYSDRSTWHSMKENLSFCYGRNCCRTSTPANKAYSHFSLPPPPIASWSW